MKIISETKTIHSVTVLGDYTAKNARIEKAMNEWCTTNLGRHDWTVETYGHDHNESIFEFRSAEHRDAFVAEFSKHNDGLLDEDEGRGWDFDEDEEEAA